MISVRQAISQIGDIREQLARSSIFRGYRSSTTAMTALIALVASGVQAYWVDDPVDDLTRFLAVWFAAALVSLGIVFSKVLFAWRIETSALNRDLSIAALLQLAPSIVAGLLVTLVIAMFHSSAAGLLPGLWMLLFSLGIFASRRNLPRSVIIPAAYYMLAGLMVLTLSPVDAMRPWVMGGIFATGQLIAAAILYLTLERSTK